MADQFAEVVFPIPLKQTFSYRVPEKLKGFAAPGMRCFVSFGHRQTVGFITGLTSKPPEKVKQVKTIDSLLDTVPILKPDLIKLGQWIADYYYCSVGEALFAILPSGQRKNPKSVLELTPEGLAHVEKVETILGEVGPLRGVNWKSLQKGTVAVSPRTLTLAEALKREGLGFITIAGKKEKNQGGEKLLLGKPTMPPQLHLQQAAAFKAIEQSLDAGVFKTFLLQGVTGSGKTEVYLRSIAQTLNKGKQAIVLIPEIALTPQTVDRFTSRFGDQVAVVHSRLDPEERARYWRRIAEGKAKVVVGARSALFAPVPQLGLIVVDEEHESSYKQEDSPRYNARDAAVKRAQLCGAVALLGSATPSLESIKNAREGKYGFLVMPDRVNQKPLPKVRVVDMKDEWRVRSGDRPILSMPLAEALRENLERNEQSILFLNRRGFNTVILCMKCGEQTQCPNCSVSVTSHRIHGVIELLCHYCDWRGSVPTKCPSCGDGPVQLVGLGTERLEDEIRSKYPKARVERMDLDTTQKKGSHEEILGRFRRHEVDILLGTQMIAKGHDFPGVTLVGIVGADTGLALPDFRSSEKVFQLLVQVSGRAGRAEKEGVIYLQTFNPSHSSVQSASTHNMDGFWAAELELRQVLGYPPFSRLGLLVYRSEIEKKAYAAAEKAGMFLEKHAGELEVEVRGPAPAGIFKLRGHYRFQILLKSKKSESVRNLIQQLDDEVETPSGVFRVVNIDPQSML